MTRKVSILTVALAVALVSPCAAQIALPFHLLPVIAKVSGAADTDWMTSASISNVGTVPAEVTALFFKENRNNIPLFGPTQRFTMAPGETLTEEDVLGTWFPLQGNTKGFLVLFGEAEEAESEPVRLAASGRIFNNADPSATYGQTVPSSLLGLVVAPAHAILTGAQWDESVRCNVGIVNLTLEEVRMVITTYAADGTVLAEVTKSVKSFSLGQWSLAQLGVSSLSTPGRVEVRVDPDTITWDPCFEDANPDDPLEILQDLQGVFLSYMSRVDQATGDAEFLLGQNDWLAYGALCGDGEIVPKGLPLTFR